MYQADISLVNNQNVVYSQHGIEIRQCVKNKTIICSLLRGSFDAGLCLLSVKYILKICLAIMRNSKMPLHECIVLFELYYYVDLWNSYHSNEWLNNFVWPINWVFHHGNTPEVLFKFKLTWNGLWSFFSSLWHIFEWNSYLNKQKCWTGVDFVHQIIEFSWLDHCRLIMKCCSDYVFL